MRTDPQQSVIGVKHVFWVVPGLLGGRPGPNYEPWDEAALYEDGFRAVLSVNGGDCVRAPEFERVGIDYRCIPLTADAPPLPGDKEICLSRLAEQMAFVKRHLDQSSPVLVHCRHGKDRTGLFFAYFLRKQRGYAPERALRELRALRPNALSADGWYDLARSVLEVC